MASYLFSGRSQQAAATSAPSGSSAALPPTIVMPQDWSVPSYLKHSVFYPRFTVSPSSLSPVASASISRAIARPVGVSTSDRTDDAGWGSATPLHSTTVDSSPVPSSAAVRMPSQATSARERYQEGLASPIAKIPLPSKLDPKHCCKRLLIQDGVVQFCPEKDDQGRDSKYSARQCLLSGMRSSRLIPVAFLQN